ncbi:MAG: glycosyltransferase family 4 protein [Anaerolineales bacterium]
MLSRFRQYWTRVDVITPRVPGAQARTLYGNVHIHPSPWPKPMQPFYILKQGRALLRQRPYALIISHDYGLFLNGLGAWLLHSGSQVPYVSELHHIEGYPFALTYREYIYRGLAAWYARRVWKRAAAIRTVNRREVPEFLRKQGVPEEKIHIMTSLYLDFSVFKPLPDVEPMYDVLFVGRLAPNKGLFTLLDALHQVRETLPNVCLGILGEGKLRRALESRIAELGLENNVTFIPRAATSADLARVYNAARMLVCASTSEGGPRVTLEAMACGVPVVSTPVGVMKDLLETSGTSFLVFGWHAEPLAEKIVLLLQNEHMRRQLAENGELTVQGFRADVIIDQLARAYQEIAEAGG